MRNIVGDYQLFKDGFGLVTIVTELTLPEIKWKTEDYTGGGVMGTRQLKTILDKLELKAKVAGIDPVLINAVGQMPGTSNNWKIMASLVVPGEPEKPQKILVTGSLTELKRDVYKPSGAAATDISVVDITYYEEWFDGKSKLQIDLLNQVLMVDGVDLMATRRRNTGRL